MDKILSSTTICDNTKRQYINRIELLLSRCSCSTLDELIHHPELLDSIECTPVTKDAYYSAVLAIFVHDADFRLCNHDLYIRWRDLHKLNRQPIEDHYKSNTPSAKQMKSYIPFDEIVRIRDSLRPKSNEKLLLAMYTYIAPMRCDYGCTYLLHDCTDESQYSNSNYILIDKSILVMNDYKTKSRYGQIRIDIPDELMTEINYRKDKQYLFTNRHGIPYTRNGYSIWANNTLKKIFNNQHVSVSVIRHSYISRRDTPLESMSIAQQESIATKMGHSVNQQRAYSWHVWLRDHEHHN